MVISIFGFSILNNHLKRSTAKELEQLTFHKKLLLEDEYDEVLSEIKTLFSDEMISNVSELKSGYFNYSSDKWSMFDADSLAKFRKLLSNYYLDEFIGKINWSKPELEEIFPERDQEIAMQYTYLFKNKWPAGEKEKLVLLEDGSSYDLYHSFIQSNFRDFKRIHGINNIYLVDGASGDVFYNLNKNIAFATNLYSGKFKSSEISKTFQEALAATDTEARFFYSDFSFFLPEYNKPMAYIALPLILYNEKVAVAVIELGSEFFENILFDEWLVQHWEGASINLIDNDNKFKLNELQQYAEPEKYAQTLIKKGIRNKTLSQAAKIGGGANIIGFKESSDQKKFELKTGTTAFNHEILYVNLPLQIKGFDYQVLGYSTVNYHKNLLRTAKSKILLVYIVLLVLATFTLRGMIKSIISRLNRLSSAFVSLSKGEKTDILSSDSNDELGKTMVVFNTLNERVNSAENFAIKLSEGDFEHDFESASEHDSLAKALNTLKDSLKTSKQDLEKREREDEITKWLNDGIAKFNDLLRQSNNDIGALAYIVIENLVGYLEANQGGVFLVEGETEATKTIHQIAGFAYDRKKYQTKTIEIGEGLIGNCYLEKKSIHLNKIPDDYVEITSGLGAATPKSLYIVPLLMDDNILGFIEIASLNEFKEHHIKFIEKLSENIAATFSTVKLNTRTAELLEESKRRANEIAQQEEEMRQNMEEMQATQEELARLRDEDEKTQNELKAQLDNFSSLLQNLIDGISGEAIIKDSHGVIVLANIQACNRYDTTIEAIKGKSDTEVLDKTIIESEHELDSDVLKNGNYYGYRTESVRGSLVEYNIEKKPIYLKHKDETGLLTIWTKADKTES